MNEMRIMRKVLIGVCGIGNGHINRQSCIIEELLKNDNKVMVVTTDNKIPILEARFPNLKVSNIFIPWISCNENGINYQECLEKYANENINLFDLFLNFCIDVEKYFNGKPDVVITDYEPNVAQYAYSSDVPLITMEQQSKYLYLEELKIGDFSIREEQIRINYFFPKYSKKIISSFFPIEILDKNIMSVPPIISKISKGKTDNNFILIYFSPYSDSENYDKIIKIVSEIKEISFKIYTKKDNEYREKYDLENVTFSNFNDDFKMDLSVCSALITTGGHQLISEALSLNIPLYVIPLNTYEQNYNALMVKQYKLGITDKISHNNILNFIEKRDEIQENIKSYKAKYYKDTWQKQFIDVFNDVVKNK